MGAANGTYESVLNLLGEVKSKTVLDCGAGKGYFTKKLVGEGAKVSACDIDLSRFELKVPSKKADFNKTIPFRNSYFDKVVSIEVIEHLENPVRFIGEINRVLKKGGQLILTTSNIQNVKSKLQFLFSSNLHWFQEREFGEKGSQHLHPVYWRELIFFLKKFNFEIEKIDTNRISGYTLYYTPKDNIFKKIIYSILNFLCDLFYYALSLLMLPKQRSILLGDILVIKATKIK